MEAMIAAITTMVTSFRRAVSGEFRLRIVGVPSAP